MKIAFVYDVIYPYVKGGGERRYYELAKRLNAQHEIHLWGMKFWEGDDVIRNDNGLLLHGVCPPKVLYIDGRRSIYQAIYYSFRLISPLLKQDYDLIDCSNIPFFPVFVCKLYAVIKRKPLVVTWHEYWGDYWYAYLSSTWKGFIAKTIEWMSSRLPDKIVAVSKHTKTDLVLHKIPGHKIQVVHNGIDFAEIQAILASDNSSDVIFAGRLIKEKNVDRLIQIIHILKKSIPRIKCYIIGDGPERKRLEKLRVELGVEKNVELLGFLDKYHDVYSMMKASKIFVLLSEREGFGMVVPEANACGLPVVVVKARHSAASSLVKHGESGFICNLDTQEIADQVYKLLTDDNTYATMKQAALEWAQLFDWDVAARSTKRIYEQLVTR